MLHTIERVKKFKVQSQAKRNHFNKRLIEETFLQTVSSFVLPTRVLKLTGEDYNYYMQSLFSSLANEVYVAEIDKKRFQTIYKQASKCPHYNRGNVNLINSDVSNLSIMGCAYVDLDIMSTLKKIDPIFEHHVICQKNTVSGIKAISATASIRFSGSSQERFDKLQEILLKNFNANLYGFGSEYGGFEPGGITLPGSVCKGHGVYAKRQIPVFTESGDIIDFHLLNYGDIDSSPYMTFLCIYQ